MNLLMQTVEDWDLLVASNVQKFVQVRDGVGLLKTVSDHVVGLAILMQEVVVWIDQDDRDVVFDHLGLRLSCDRV